VDRAGLRCPSDSIDNRFTATWYGEGEWKLHLQSMSAFVVKREAFLAMCPFLADGL
jgi:hypothetical protein